MADDVETPAPVGPLPIWFVTATPEGEILELANCFFMEELDAFEQATGMKAWPCQEIGDTRLYKLVDGEVVLRSEEIPVDLEARKAEAVKAIDRDAESIRGLFMTLGSGQAMVYDQKRDEAEALMANPEIQVGEIPHLASEAEMNDIPIFDQAVIYLTMRQQWLTVSPIIERRRLVAKRDVAAATTVAQVEAAAAVDWSDIQALV